MNQPTPIADLRLADLIARISGIHVSPGAGAAGAVALALAAACAGKAVSISIKHRPAEAALQLAAARFSDIARLALTDADRDAVAFEGFVRGRTADAAARLVCEGENLAQAIDELLGAIDAVESWTLPSMAGDLAAARALAGAARRIQERNEAETKNADVSTSGQ